MSAVIPAHPLTWPAGWRRTAGEQRTAARFNKRERKHSSYQRGDGTTHSSSWTQKKEISIADAVQRVRDELQRMGVRDHDLVISTNLELRLDGWPRSGQREPGDPGVAVYWREPGQTGAPRCMAVDRYDRVADNLAAVAATLDAMRAIERHGGAEILQRAYTGFTALPPPADLRTWWQVLGVAESARGAAVTEAYRRLRAKHHPDRDGDAAEFQAVQAAYDQAAREGIV
jgi:hypothetical protein